MFSLKSTIIFYFNSAISFSCLFSVLFTALRGDFNPVSKVFKLDDLLNIACLGLFYGLAAPRGLPIGLRIGLRIGLYVGENLFICFLVLELLNLL